MKRFSLERSSAKDLLGKRIELRQVLALFARGQVERPSQIVTCLRKLPMEGLLFMMAKTTRDETRKAISEYITALRTVTPLLSGADLIQMGYSPGPVFTSILRSLRDAKLDGIISTEKEARELVARLFPWPVSDEASPGR